MTITTSSKGVKRQAVKRSMPAPKQLGSGAQVRSIDLIQKQVHAKATSLISNKLCMFTRWSGNVARSDAGERIKIIRNGVDATILVSASEHFNMPRAVMAQFLGISPATAERKIKSRGLLGQAESERLERLALIENEAAGVFGNADNARAWLTRKNHALGASPLSLLDTDVGAGEVRKVLAAIAYGGVV